MIGALWILLFTASVGQVLYLFELRYRRKNRGADKQIDDRGDSTVPSSPDTSASVAEEDLAVNPGDGVENGGECCGLHLVCEKDSLSPLSDEVIYYDDEELDRFVGRTPESYSPEETEEFRDVLMTLRPEDVPGWARSVTLRRLELPPEVRDELLMLVNEQRK